jgi:hypothetical protein
MSLSFQNNVFNFSIIRLAFSSRGVDLDGAADLDVLQHRSLVFTQLSAPAITISPSSFRLFPGDSTFS